jgi:hypothetical protein
MKLSASLSIPAILFYGLLILFQMMECFYLANRLELPYAFTLLYQLGLKFLMSRVDEHGLPELVYAVEREASSATDERG